MIAIRWALRSILDQRLPHQIPALHRGVGLQRIRQRLGEGREFGAVGVGEVDRLVVGDRFSDGLSCGLTDIFCRQVFASVSIGAQESELALLQPEGLSDLRAWRAGRPTLNKADKRGVDICGTCQSWIIVDWDIEVTDLVLGVYGKGTDTLHVMRNGSL